MAKSFNKAKAAEAKTQWFNEPMEAFTSEEATKLFAEYRKARDAEKVAKQAIAAMISRHVGYKVNVGLDRIDWQRRGPGIDEGPSVGYTAAKSEPKTFTLEIKRTF